MTQLSKVTSPILLAFALLVALFVGLSQEAQAQTNYGFKSIAFNGITSTTTSCASFPLSDVAHVQVIADVTVVNTSTIETLFSNNATNYTVGETLSATVETDTPAVAEGNLYTVTLQAVNTCIRVTPTNTNPITITAVIFAPLAR